MTEMEKKPGRLGRNDGQTEKMGPAKFRVPGKYPDNFLGPSQSGLQLAITPAGTGTIRRKKPAPAHTGRIDPESGMGGGPLTFFPIKFNKLTNFPPKMVIGLGWPHPLRSSASGKLVLA